MTTYYGKYRGKVEQNVDPEQRGRLMVSVAAVTGSGTLNWALPCVPFAGPGVGFFAIPPVGADIWVEYEGGDPDAPIWSGGFWTKGSDVPASPAVAQQLVIKTNAGTLTISELPTNTGVTIETAAGMKVKLGATSLEIDDGTNGSISLTGTKVSVNKGALEVT